jgi:CheY-like chemotaxis protein
MSTAKKILVVDDEPGICEGVELVLGRAGFDVSKALSGEEAIRRIEAESFDGILVDMILPGIDGVETCAMARRLQPSARIIAITGSPTGEKVEQLTTSQNIDAYLYKPFGKKELLEVIAKALQ